MWSQCISRLCASAARISRCWCIGFWNAWLGDSIQVTNAAMKALLQYDWPGNVRELQNCIERAVALGNRELIDVYDLPPALRNSSGSSFSPSSSGELPLERSFAASSGSLGKVSAPGISP